MKFIIHYSDHKTAVENVGDDYSPRDVQVIVQEHPTIGWHTQSGYDYYVWRDGRWVGVDIFGLYDFLLDIGLVLFGRTLTQSEFNDVMKRALEDLGEAKNGWTRDEKKLDG